MSSIGISWIDLVIAAIIGLSALISLFRGFVREALSLLTWIAAFWIGLSFCHPVSDWLIPYVNSPTLRLGIAFGVLFVLMLILGGIVNYLISSLVSKTGLGSMDRLLGIIFGAARGVLLAAALLLVAQLTPMPQEAWWQDSLLIPHLMPIEKWLESLLPEPLAQKFELSVKG